MKLANIYGVGWNLCLMQSILNLRHHIETPIQYLSLLHTINRQLKSNNLAKKTSDEINELISSWEEKYYKDKKINYDTDLNLIESNIPVDEENLNEFTERLNI